MTDRPWLTILAGALLGILAAIVATQVLAAGYRLQTYDVGTKTWIDYGSAYNYSRDSNANKRDCNAAAYDLMKASSDYRNRFPVGTFATSRRVFRCVEEGK